jgi:glycosyltransferase involved in cell wall biosynthesis
MGKSLISVIVPIYNVSRYLERCMESLLHQTYKNMISFRMKIDKRL